MLLAVGPSITAADASVSKSDGLHPISVMTTRIIRAVTEPFRSKELLTVDKEKGIEPGKPRYSPIELALLISTIAFLQIFIIIPIAFWYIVVVVTEYQGPLYEESEFEGFINRAKKEVKTISKKLSKTMIGVCVIRQPLSIMKTKKIFPKLEFC